MNIDTAVSRAVRITRTSFLPFAAGLVVLPLLWQGIAAASVGSANTVIVTPATAGTANDFRVPLVGSPSYLVYRDSHSLTDSLITSRDAPSDDASSRRLTVRNALGVVSDLGAMPQDDDWSLSGTTLAASANSIDTPRRVDYWDVASDNADHLTLPAHTAFAAAAPDGIIYVGETGTATNAVAGHVYLRHFNGTVDDFSAPYGDQAPLVTSGDNGIVVTNGGHQAMYRTFAAEGSFVQLAPAGKQALNCEAVVGAYAACSGVNADGDIRSDQVIPLSGDAATRTTVSPGDVALSGSTLLWAGTPSGETSAHIFSLDAGSSDAPRSSSETLGYTGSAALVAALGGGVGAATDDSALYLAHTSTDVTSILDAEASPVSAASFSLTEGRIAYTDDEAASSAAVSTFSTSYTTSGSTVTLDPQQLVKAGTYSPLVASSGAGTVYATKTGSQTVMLTVVTPTITRTIAGALRFATPTLSGNRLLYFTTSKKGNAETARIFNVATGKSSLQRRSGSCCLADLRTALSGRWLAYLTADDSVWVKNLKSGKITKVHNAPTKVALTPQVFVAGNHVGWAYQTGTPPHLAIKDGYRNVHTMSTPVAVHQRIWALADSGVILDNDTAAEFSGGGIEPANATSFGFRPYNGTTHHLLPSQAFVQGPQVVGSTVAWIDEHGALQLANF